MSELTERELRLAEAFRLATQHAEHLAAQLKQARADSAAAQDALQDLGASLGAYRAQVEAQEAQIAELREHVEAIEFRAMLAQTAAEIERE
jgi:predicted  nucleic acid-binding Zn-ribbon protein